MARAAVLDIDGWLGILEIHSGQTEMIYIHVEFNELLHTIAGNAQFGDCGAR